MDVAPSNYRPMIHDRTTEIVDYVNNYFDQVWKWRDSQARDRFLASNLPRLFCLMYPLAKESRIVYPCILFTLLFLIDDMLDAIPPHDAPDLYIRLFQAATGMGQPPEKHQSAEYIMYHIFDDMRGKSNSHVPPVLRACLAFIREEIVADRQLRRSFGEYMDHHLGEIETAYSSLPLDHAPPSQGRRALRRPRCTPLSANGCVGFHRLVVSMIGFAMGIQLELNEQQALLALESNLGRHLIVIGDVYTHEKEALIEDVKTGTLMNSAVTAMKDEAGIDHAAAKRVLIRIAREYEDLNQVLVDKLTIELGGDSFEDLPRDVRVYVQALRNAAAGNEAWCMETFAHISIDSRARSIIAGAPRTTLTRAPLGSHFLHRPSSQRQQRTFETPSGMTSPSEHSTEELYEFEPSKGSPTQRKAQPLLRIDTGASGSSFKSFGPSNRHLKASSLPQESTHLHQAPNPSGYAVSSRVPDQRARQRHNTEPELHRIHVSSHNEYDITNLPSAEGLPRAFKGPGIEHAIPGTMTTGATPFRSDVASPTHELTLNLPRAPVTRGFFRSLSHRTFGRSRSSKQTQESSPDDYQYTRDPGTLNKGSHTSEYSMKQPEIGSSRLPAVLQATQARRAQDLANTGGQQGLMLPPSGLPRARSQASFASVSPTDHHYTQQGLPSYSNVVTATEGLRPATQQPPFRTASTVSYFSSPSEAGSPEIAHGASRISSHYSQQVTPEQNFQEQYEMLREQQRSRGMPRQSEAQMSLHGTPEVGAYPTPQESQQLQSSISPGDEISPPITAVRVHAPFPVAVLGQPRSESLAPLSWVLPRSSSSVVIRDPETGEVKKFNATQRKGDMSLSQRSSGSGIPTSPTADPAVAEQSDLTNPHNRSASKGDGRKVDPETRERKAAEMKEAVMKSLRESEGWSHDEQENEEVNEK